MTLNKDCGSLKPRLSWGERRRKKTQISKKPSSLRYDSALLLGEVKGVCTLASPRWLAWRSRKSTFWRLDPFWTARRLLTWQPTLQGRGGAARIETTGSLGCQEQFPTLRRMQGGDPDGDMLPTYQYSESNSLGWVSHSTMLRNILFLMNSTNASETSRSRFDPLPGRLLGERHSRGGSASSWQWVLVSLDSLLPCNSLSIPSCLSPH